MCSAAWTSPIWSCSGCTWATCLPSHASTRQPCKRSVLPCIPATMAASAMHCTALQCFRGASTTTCIKAWALAQTLQHCTNFASLPCTLTQGQEHLVRAVFYLCTGIKCSSSIMLFQNCTILYDLSIHFAKDGTNSSAWSESGQI